MRVCPVNLEACCDDICHGAGCIQSAGEDMVEICQHCHAPMLEGLCECDDEFEATTTNHTPCPPGGLAWLGVPATRPQWYWTRRVVRGFFLEGI